MASSNWVQTSHCDSRSYTCGYCGRLVASRNGYVTQKSYNSPVNEFPVIYLCPNCHRPTFFEAEQHQVPSPVLGNDLNHLPEGVHELYNEIRKTIGAGCFTSTALSCRALLLYIAISTGAEPGQSFAAYVDYLLKGGFIPSVARDWVDHLRREGNRATHEIVLLDRAAAHQLFA